MVSLNCFSSNSNQQMAVVAGNIGGGVGAVGQQGAAHSHRNHNRFSGSWSICCSLPSQLISSLFGCCLCGHERKRRPSFNHNRRVSFPDLNSTLFANNAMQQPTEQQQTNDKPEPTKQSVPESECDPKVNNVDNNNDNQQRHSTNIINRLLFGFFRRRRNSSSRGVNAIYETDPNSAQHHHHHHHQAPGPPPVLHQLSVTALANHHNSHCDLNRKPIKNTNNKIELLESNKNNNMNVENVMHNHNHHQQQHPDPVVPLPCSSSSNVHNHQILQPSICEPSSSPSKCPSTASFVSSLAKTAFKSKKTISPTVGTNMIGISHEQQQLRMDVSSKRLMKEIGDLMRRKQNHQLTANFTIELINDSLYEWYIKIYEFDKESQIYMDMQQYQISYVQLHAIFPESYPFDPPFIRVVAPYIERGYVMEGGAICLELLTKTGWTSAYTMESVIIQLMASFVKGQATIKATKDVSKCFTKKSAVNSFRHIVRIHDKHGWVDTPLYEG